MTRMLACAAALTLLALAAGPALAAEVSLQKLSAEEMKALCEKAGTSFSEDKSGYGCVPTPRAGAAPTACVLPDERQAMHCSGDGQSAAKDRPAGARAGL
jgi:hypothetical protein